MCIYLNTYISTYIYIYIYLYIYIRTYNKQDDQRIQLKGLVKRDGYTCAPSRGLPQQQLAPWIWKASGLSVSSKGFV